MSLAADLSDDGDEGPGFAPAIDRAALKKPKATAAKSRLAMQPASPAKPQPFAPGRKPAPQAEPARTQIEQDEAAEPSPVLPTADAAPHRQESSAQIEIETPPEPQVAEPTPVAVAGLESEPEPVPAELVERIKISLGGEEVELDPAALEAVPARLAIAALAIPFALEDGALRLYVAEPVDSYALHEIADASGTQVVPEGRPVADIVAAIRHLYLAA